MNPRKLLVHRARLSDGSALDGGNGSGKPEGIGGTVGGTDGEGPTPADADGLGGEPLGTPDGIDDAPGALEADEPGDAASGIGAVRMAAAARASTAETAVDADWPERTAPLDAEAAGEEPGGADALRRKMVGIGVAGGSDRGRMGARDGSTGGAPHASGGDGQTGWGGGGARAIVTAVTPERMTTKVTRKTPTTASSDARGRGANRPAGALV